MFGSDVFIRTGAVGRLEAVCQVVVELTSDAKKKFEEHAFVFPTARGQRSPHSATSRKITLS